MYSELKFINKIYLEKSIGSEGNADVIDWCNTLAKKKIIKFLKGVLHLLLL